MRLVVTRPRGQAGSHVAALRALGHLAEALPLIDIAPAADSAPLHAAWATLPANDLLLFVSANAVAQFFALRPDGAGWPRHLQAGATGPGTSAALRAAGVPPGAIVAPPDDAPSFDSEALWAQLAPAPWAGRRVLVVRGEDGRDWLTDTLRAHGAQVDFVAAYARRPPQLDAAGRRLLDEAVAAPQGHIWLFSSSEAVANLLPLAPHAAWHDARALASHARIEAAARAAGFGRVEQVQPSPEAVSRHLRQEGPAYNPPLP